MTVNLAVDYNAQLAGEEEVQDGEKKTRAAYLLKLTAKNPDVTYHQIDYWLDRSNSRPIKAKFYSASDRLLKTAYYRKFDLQLGQERPTETVIIDGLDPQWVTVLRNSDFTFRDVPESWLQRDFLPRFKAE